MNWALTEQGYNNYKSNIENDWIYVVCVDNENHWIYDLLD